MELNFVEIGRNVRIARKRKGLKQEELAEAINVTTHHISHIETGQTHPSLTALVAIANVLDTDANSLLGNNIQKIRDSSAEDELLAMIHSFSPKKYKMCEDFCKYINESEDLVDL